MDSTSVLSIPKVEATRQTYLLTAVHSPAGRSCQGNQTCILLSLIDSKTEGQGAGMQQAKSILWKVLLRNESVSSTAIKNETTKTKRERGETYRLKETESHFNQLQFMDFILILISTNKL